MGKTYKRRLPADIENSIWCIFYIQKDFVDDLEKDLNKDHDFKDIKVYLPTINSLSLDFHGKQKVKKIPAVFNYGFIRMPKENAYSPSFLRKLKVSISCIYSWVLDPARGKNSMAYATNKEIITLARTLENSHLYSGDDISNLKIGSFITLQGYPFDGLEAKVVDIHPNKREADVELNMFHITKKVRVNFENIFYTVYQSNFQESPFRDIHIEDIIDNTNQLDNLFFKNGHYEEIDC